jgi:hypothetical protein
MSSLQVGLQAHDEQASDQHARENRQLQRLVEDGVGIDVMIQRNLLRSCR